MSLMIFSRFRMSSLVQTLLPYVVIRTGDKAKKGNAAYVVAKRTKTTDHCTQWQYGPITMAPMDLHPVPSGPMAVNPTVLDTAD